MPATCPTCGKLTLVESLIIPGRYLCMALRCSSGYIPQLIVDELVPEFIDEPDFDHGSADEAKND